ncbi:MAG TPA: hypothetical protein VJN88_01015 [Ktedonobacterales bacterium]|nr:hypothetical protein [Ktedonobacterales bacterium]
MWRMGLRRGPWLTFGVLALALLLSACGGAKASAAPTTSASTATTRPAPTATVRPSGTPTATPIAITDLATFRQKIADAFTSNTWSSVAPLLSPGFSYQGTNSGGARLVMPDSATDLQGVYANGGPWSQSAQYEVDIHSCFAGGAPTDQQIGFDGGGGSFMLLGMDRYQGYWVVAWAFQDPLGGGDGCAYG